MDFAAPPPSGTVGAIACVALGATIAAAAAWLSGAAATPIVLAAPVGGAVGIMVIVAWRRALLRAEDKYFLTLIEASHTGHVITVADGSIVYVNSSVRELLSPRADPSAPLASLLGEEGGEIRRQIAYLNDLAVQGGRSGFEVPLKRPSGSTMWLSVDARPLVQRPGRVLWRFEDVTARREMEQVIREERARFVDFLDNSTAGFYTVDRDGRFQYVNYTFADWLGYTADELLKGEVKLHDLLAAPLPAGAPAYQLLGSGSARGEVTLKGRSGKPFPMSVIQAIKSGADAPFLIRTIAHDLSAERRLIEAARRSESMFQKLFEESPIGVAVLDGVGRVKECNPAFRGFVGGDGTGPVGRRLEELVAPDDSPAVARRFTEVAAGTHIVAPVEVRSPGTRPRAGAVYFLPMEADAQAAPEGPRVLVHLIDLTQQKYFEAQAAQSQKMQAVGQLAGGIAHDFNNLLTVMIGFCDLLLLRHRPGEQTFADIMQIKQNANRAANLVRQLLAFSRQQTLQPKVLDITDILADLSNLLRRLIGVNISLKVVHGRDLGLIRVDQVQLEQVLINLVVNARDAMTNGGTLVVRTSNVTVKEPARRGGEIVPPGNYVLLEVTDTGVGIPPENLERIFEPFFSTKEVGAGTGLGLATVYGIVKQTGGFIAVDSRVGAGSTFAIYLPRHGEGEEGTARARAPGGLHEEQAEIRDLTGAGTVLLVEDEDAVRLFASRALKNKGYAVIEAKNGEKAMEAIESAGRRLDLLITDVVMPAMDGPTLVKAARGRFPDLRVIFISGYAEDSFRERVEHDAGIHFLPKPFSLLQLAGKVKEVLG
ncbi:MAG TPA: PAS domain S-box protein [Alphaproteobacteria bacterium]|nr:PAS domain S-box protein [Alphaproteobacteria bacterium]